TAFTRRTKPSRPKKGLRLPPRKPKLEALFMKHGILMVALLAATSALAADMVPLKTELPKPLFVGTPVPIKVPNLEPPQKGKRPDFMVPAGTTNIALGKKVTSSDSEPVIGTLYLVTDGDKEGDEGS